MSLPGNLGCKFVEGCRMRQTIEHRKISSTRDFPEGLKTVQQNRDEKLEDWSCKTDDGPFEVDEGLQDNVIDVEEYDAEYEELMQEHRFEESVVLQMSTELPEDMQDEEFSANASSIKLPVTMLKRCKKSATSKFPKAFQHYETHVGEKIQYMIISDSDDESLEDYVKSEGDSEPTNMVSCEGNDQPGAISCLPHLYVISDDENSKPAQGDILDASGQQIAHELGIQMLGASEDVETVSSINMSEHREINKEDRESIADKPQVDTTESKTEVELADESIEIIIPSRVMPKRRKIFAVRDFPDALKSY